MYEGYLHFAGTEIANAARTLAYVENIMPRFGFQSCWDSADLPCILGDAPYRTPVLDPAPWFSEARPASNKFFGFYPLSVVGVEDSSREVNVTQLVQDGAVFSLPRKASKEFRVSGLLLAEDGEGIDVGMSWLRGALEGTDCDDGGDCAGDTFCYMAYLPACCDYNNSETFPLVPVDERWTSGSTGSWVSYNNGKVQGSTDGVLVAMPCPGDGAQYYVQGLIPGENYRVTVEMASAATLTLGIGGGVSITAKRANEHFPDGRNPWVLDFVAKGEMETVRVLSGEDECAPDLSPDTAHIYGIRVERTAEQLSKFLPRFTNESFTEPASWTPIGTTDPAVIQRSIAVSGPNSIEELSLIWTNISATTTTFAANSGGRRLIRGLTNGQEYIVHMKVGMSNGAGQPFGLGLHYRIASLAADGTTVITIPSSVVDLGSDWVEITFTASQPQHYLDILTNGVSNLTSSGDDQTAEINVWYIRVDADPQTLYIQPVDQSKPALRTLHNVTLLDGPNVVEQFTKEHGAMTSVEFTMAVGEPNIYGQLIEIQPTIEATTYLIGNTQCQQGLPVRYNLFSNPRLAGEAVGSTPMLGVGVHGNISSGLATVTVAAPNGIVAEQSARIAATGANDSWMAVPVDEAGDLLPGHTYTVSATLSMTAPQTGALNAAARTIRVIHNGGTVSSVQGSNVAGAQRLSVTFTYLSGDVSIRFYNGAPSGGIVFWSNFLFEESGFPGSPFDGDSPEGSWTGTIHQSTSKWAEDKPAVITDPDCTPVPVAPQPPGILPDCPRSVDEWRRYWMQIPPELAGGWRESVPVIKLSTSQSVVRDVRVRFYANALDAPLGEVDECGACGEFYISYIPQSTVMTIDGIRRRVTANVAGTGEENAMHLASDTDYGPVRWPTMTCDIAYYMTVDIAPDEVLDLDIQLAVAQRE